MPRVLLIGCRQPMRDGLVEGLSAQGIDVVVRAGGHQGMEAMESLLPDGALVQDPLPDVGVTEVIRRAQRAGRGSQVPLIVAAESDNEMERIVALELGARDYVVAPISARELVLRLLNAMRGASLPGQTVGQEGGPQRIRVDLRARRITMPSRTIALSRKEMNILVSLMNRPEHVWSRQELRAQVWGQDTTVSNRTVDGCVKRLRAKIASDRPLVETVWGQGYRLASGGRSLLEVTSTD